MALLKINNVQPKAPSSYQVTISDIDKDSYRTASGKVIRNRVAVKRKIELTWKSMTKSELSTLLGLIEDEFFSVTYLDPKSGTNQTRTFYVGDRTSPVAVVSGGKMVWVGVSMNFIEQ